VIKVTFVGAGSIEFTRNVVTDLCSYPEFHGRLHLSLHDISAERLSHAERLARRIAAQTGCGAEVTATAGRRAAFIHSLQTGQERELHVNIRNGRLISSLPANLLPAAFTH
jgi:alpha-galactosidase/6-phospho-beta-glucosidase family protein